MEAKNRQLLQTIFYNALADGRYITIILSGNQKIKSEHIFFLADYE